MDHETRSAIAIIGIACRFPESSSPDQFWDNLCKGKECITRSSTDTTGNDATTHVPAQGVLSDIELFDADFFSMSAKEAQITDPQHRIFLECAWETLENAGYSPDTYSGTIGVYGGSSISTYYLHNLHANQAIKTSAGDYLLRIGNDKDFLTTKVSYKLNLKGPSLSIQTACSTSLVAINIACNHLLTYQCDMALAGAATISVPQGSYTYQEGMIFSPDGHCRPFDAQAQGTVPSNGIGLVLLKRLEDAVADRDHIYAIITGYGTNNDGINKVGYAAPSKEGQAQAILSALAMAEVNPEAISCVEAHGTGTLLGDPIEIAALTEAYRTYTDEKQYCALGSVKGNLGHLMETAGVASVIKVALSLYNKEIPPTLHINQPNPHIDFLNSPFYLNTSLKSWDSPIPRCAGVSSFGIGGTNAHIILEEYPIENTLQKTRPCHLLLCSAKTETALQAICTNLEKHLLSHPQVPLVDVAYTLQVGRKVFEHKKAIIVPHNKEVKLNYVRQELSKEPKVVFAFSDELSPYVNMSLELYQTEPCYRQHIDECSEVFKSLLGIDFREVLYPHTHNKEFSEINSLPVAQVISFSIKYALAKLWQEWGVCPHAVLGQGTGEYAAACIAGVFSLENGAFLLNQHHTRTVRSSPPDAQEKFNKIELKSPTVSYLSNRDGNYSSREDVATHEYWIAFPQTISSSTDLPAIYEGPYVEMGRSCLQSKSCLLLGSLPSRSETMTDSEKVLSGLGQLWLAGVSVDWQGFNKYENCKRTPLPTYPFERKRYWIDPPSHTDQKQQTVREKKDFSSRDQVNSIIHSIWIDLLGTETIGFHDDFFQLGGDSIIAIQVISNIKTHFGLDLGMQMLVQFPTISQLSEEIYKQLSVKHAGQSSENDSIVITLKPGEKTECLFLIHPIEGHVGCYKQLIDQMKFQGTIYGLQAIELDSSQKIHFETIEKMATYYVQKIRTIQPQSPYRLTGFSFGGLLAYEMARQLREQTYDVAFLGMIDVINPETASYYNLDPESMIALLIELLSHEAINIDEFRKLPRSEQVTRLMTSMGLEKLAHVQQTKIFEQMQIHFQALANYHPQPYDKPIVFFDAVNRAPYHSSLSPGMSWKNLATAGLTVHEIVGSHRTMMTAPGVLQLAGLLDTYLQQRTSTIG